MKAETVVLRGQWWDKLTTVAVLSRVAPYGVEGFVCHHTLPKLPHYPPVSDEDLMDGVTVTHEPTGLALGKGEDLEDALEHSKVRIAKAVRGRGLEPTVANMSLVLRESAESAVERMKKLGK